MKRKTSSVRRRQSYDKARTKQKSVAPRKPKTLKTEKRIRVESKVERKRLAWYRVRVISVVVLGFLLIFGGVVGSTLVRADEYQTQQESYVAEIETGLAGCYEDYEKEVPKMDFEVTELDEFEMKLGRVRAKKYDEKKQMIEGKIVRLREFAELREQIKAFFQDGILKAEIKAEEVVAVEKEFAEMMEGYREVLQVKLDILKHQYQAIVDLKSAVIRMFTDESMETVRDDLTREQYDEVRARADALPQREIAEQYIEALEKAKAALDERDRIAEEARRKAVEEYRRRQEAIAAAWHIINVPYWSQNGEGVKNGCEAASLLMGLQYKGYLGGMNLRTYAEMMPKSDDPFTGFRGDIFGSAGSDAPFWIAPAPLAAFGRSSSGANVVDITGSSLDMLDAEVAAGNPVVIYLTLQYVAPSAWRYGAPANLHVMLLTGYNSMTGVHRVTDPLTLNGRTYYDLPRSQVESIFNATGKRAVVIR